MSERVKSRGSKHNWFGKIPHHRKGSYGNSGYRKDLGHFVRSNWEADFSRILKLRGKEYKYEPKAFPFIFEGRWTTYRPDFLVGRTYYEVKRGFIKKERERKLYAFMKAYPKVKLKIVDAPVMAEFALKYKNLIEWECPKIPDNCKFVKVKEAKYIGVKDTYDITMKTPGNNYIANTFVVHNSWHAVKGLHSMKPRHFEDLVALNALLRPGTSSAGTDRKYFDRMNGHEKVEYDHPLLEKVLKKTYGIMLYQEQITEIAHVLGGLSLSDADKFRTAIKKFDSAAMEKFKPQFIEGALKNGCKDRKEAKHIYNLVHSFSGYGFNRNHSCAYTLYSYFLMWFKVYYPLIFFCVLLRYPKDKKNHLPIIREDIINHKIKLRKPNINLSKDQAIISGDALVWSLSGVKFVGDSVMPEILKNQPYKSIKDYMKRAGKGAHKRAILNLLNAGAFDKFGSKTDLVEQIFSIRGEDINKDKIFKKYKQRTFWIEQEKEVLGFSFN